MALFNHGNTLVNKSIEPPREADREREEKKVEGREKREEEVIEQTFKTSE